MKRKLPQHIFKLGVYLTFVCRFLSQIQQKSADNASFARVCACFSVANELKNGDIWVVLSTECIHFSISFLNEFSFHRIYIKLLGVLSIQCSEGVPPTALFKHHSEADFYIFITKDFLSLWIDTKPLTPIQHWWLK